jgi:hypothetical protein
MLAIQKRKCNHRKDDSQSLLVVCTYNISPAIANLFFLNCPLLEYYLGSLSKKNFHPWGRFDLPDVLDI